jgi:putative ATP-dependent endonuclease of the OLD family
LYLEHISIENFRLFKRLDLTLNRGLNVLVGENDSGKTALIDAIRYTLGTNSSEKAYVNENDFFADDNSDSHSLSVQLKFVDIEEYGHIFVEHLSYEESRSVLYITLTAQKTGQEKRGRPFIKTELKSGKNGNGLSIDSEIRDFLSTAYLKPLRDAETELSSGKGSRLSQILSSFKDFKDPKVMDRILGIIAETNSKLIKDLSIKAVSDKIKDDYLHNLIFKENKENLSAIINIAGIQEEKLIKLSDSEQRRHMRTFFETLSLSLTADGKKHGLGYYNLLCMAAELLLLKQEVDNEFSLLLIEEPEAHLHPQLQMKLLQFITASVKTKDNAKGIQCLLSTHSPNIASKADPADVIIMKEGKAFSLRPEETELEEKDYKFLRKFLDVTKANLFFAQSVVVVEGPSENILLPTIAKLLGRPLEDYGVSIIVSNNSGSWQRFAKIFLRKNQDANSNSWNPIKLAVLRDLDLWPACAEDNDSNKYGYIKRTKRNETCWLDPDKEKQKLQIERTVEKHKKDGNTTLEKQHVKVFISDKWTLEYCLAYFGLFEECCKALPIYETFPEMKKEEMGTYIQSKVGKKKPEFALQMAEILEQEYTNKPMELRKKLPQYITDAIEYVTSPVGDNEFSTEDKINDSPF